MAYISQEEKKSLAPKIKKVLAKYGMRGSISIRHHSSLVVTLQSGLIDFEDYSHGDGYIQVNTYHIETQYKGTAKAFLTELLAAMKGPDYFNNDDAMTDYFSRSHYTDINVGKWNKPYLPFAGWIPGKKAPKKVVQAPSSNPNIKLPTNSTITEANDTAETLARMNGKELNSFVDSLMDRYPSLGENIMSQIGYSMLEKEGV
jgi:hypothetical protein|tara:strand:+ start:119 stop:724 length:606 start_codon:yes stop_codon:yes gene_type:complete